MTGTEHTIAEDVLIRPQELPWIPQGSPKVWFKPIRINPDRGEWVNLLKVAKQGVVNRHRHLAEVEGWVVQGSGTTSSTIGKPSPAHSCTSHPARSTHSSRMWRTKASRC